MENRRASHPCRKRGTPRNRWIDPQAATLVRWIALCATVSTLGACVGNTRLKFLDPQGPLADALRWHFYRVLGIMAVLVARPIVLVLPFFLALSVRQQARPARRHRARVRQPAPVRARQRCHDTPLATMAGSPGAPERRS